MSAPRAAVVGAGVSGAACAQVLRAAGIEVSVVDRGRRPGGRLGTRRVELAGGAEHVVDTGAAYFTVSDEAAGGADGGADGGATGAPASAAAFAGTVSAWSSAGLATPWTDTLSLLGPDGPRGSTTGPQRWRAPGALRSLVTDHLLEGLDVETGRAVRSVGVADGRPALDGEPVDAVVLAMPDPQAGRMLDVGASPGLAAARRVLSRAWDPVTTVYAVWDEPWWPALTAGFVADDDLLSLVADDGARRGDGAPVLVAHTTGPAALEHLGDPDALVAPVLERLGAVLGVASPPAPRSAAAHRWSFASPQEAHEQPHLLTAVAGGLLGVCGDGWAATASGKPRVEQAWRSGHELGRALAERLA